MVRVVATAARCETRSAIDPGPSPATSTLRGKENGRVTSYLRSARLVPIWVLLITLTLMVLAATQVVPKTVGPTGMVAAFVDTNGNGIDDTCEDPATVVADQTAADAAEKAVDLNGDGTISVSEAAQSDRIGGENCNHGGYVSWVAHGSCPDAAPAPAAPLVTGPTPEEGATTAS